MKISHARALLKERRHRAIHRSRCRGELRPQWLACPETFLLPSPWRNRSAGARRAQLTGPVQFDAQFIQLEFALAFAASVYLARCHQLVPFEAWPCWADA